jgi:hypothetical protein
MIGVANGGTGIRIASNQALNVHPSRAGNLVLANGTSGTISWCIRRATAVTAATHIQIPEKFIHITYGPTIPATQSFRGGLTSVDKKSIVRRADIDVTRLPNLTAYAGLQSQAACLAVDVVDVQFGMSGEPLQRINLHDALEGQGYNYSTFFCQKRADIHHRMISNVTGAEKLAFVDKLIERANDMVALDSIGNNWSAGAGQALGGQWLDVILAYILTRMPIYLKVARRIRGSAYDRCYYPQVADLRRSGSGFPTGASVGARYQQPELPEHLGDALRYTDNGRDTLPSARYSEVVWNGFIAEAISMFVVKDALGTEVWKEIVRPQDDHAIGVETNMHFARKFYKRGPVNYYGSTNPNTRHTAAWDAWLPLSSHVPLGFRPEQPVKTWQGASPLFNNTAILASAGPGAGEITFDLTDYNADNKNHSQHPLTALPVYVSLDQTQWHKFANVGYSPRISEIVPGVPLGIKQHHLAYSLENAYGESLKSPTFRFNEVNSGGSQTRATRFDVTPTGTPANSAPAFVVNPKTYYDAAPQWGGNDWREVVGGAVPAGIGSIKIGSGYCSGYPYPAMDYKAQQNTGTHLSPVWVDIPSTNAAVYEFTPADVGLEVRIGLRGTNSSGNTGFVFSDAVLVPAAPALAPGVLFETEFSLDWSLYYPAQAAATTALNGTKVHSKSVSWGELDTPAGGIFSDKSNQGVLIGVSLGTYPAGNYKVSYDIPVGYSAQGILSTTNDYGVTGARTIRNQASSVGATTWAATITDVAPNVSLEPYLFKVVGQTFTLPSSQPVFVVLQLPAGVGGTVSGDPGFTYMKLENN